MEPAPEPVDAPPQAPAPAPQKPFWALVRERKLVQWTLAYGGAALAIAQGNELLAGVYGWPPAVSRTVITLLVLGLPLAVALAWYHGEKGLQRISAGEMMVVSVLLLVLGGGFFVLAPEPATRAGTSQQAAAPSEQQEPPANTPAATRPVGAKPRIAVMPFGNLSPDPDNAFFTDGMHEEIIATLANRAPGLEVVSRTTMMLYRAAPKSTREIAAELGATHVLEGSVRRDGEDVRLTLQLIEAEPDRHIWAQNFDRKLVRAMTLQSEVAEEVAAALSIRLAGGLRGMAPTQDPIAYDLYLKAQLDHPGLREPLAEFETALARLDEALTRDPNFALAYLARLTLHHELIQGNFDASAARLERLRADLDAVTRLAPGEPAILAAEATWNCLHERYDLALEQFAAAMAAGLADTQQQTNYAQCLAETGRYDEARAVHETAVAADPRNSLWLAIYASQAMSARRPLDSLRAVELRVAGGEANLGLGARSRLLARFAGRTEGWLETVTAPDGLAVQLDPEVLQLFKVEALITAHRYEDALRALDGAPAIVRWRDEYLESVGTTPVARFRGWVNLLRDDRRAAAADGRAVLDFVAQQQPTQWNGWFLRVLEAEGRLFAGDMARAQTAAREAVNATAASRNLLHRTAARYMAATALAWAGAHDEATALLEEVSTSSPGMAPAPIARDPRLTLPLAEDPRYRALQARLEDEMAAFAAKVP